jgi:hypothetical protein
MRHDIFMRLLQWANDTRGQRFEWGNVDCITIGLSAAEIITGRELSIPVEWHDEASARAAMARLLPSAWLVANGFKRLERWQAQGGDILLAPSDEFPECVHIHLGKHALTASPAHGVGYVRTADVLAVATGAWRVL